MKLVLIGDDDRICNWVAAMTEAPRWLPGEGRAIGLTSNGALVAGVVFDRWNGRSMCLHVATLGGGHVFTRDFFYQAFWYAFDAVGVAKLVAPVCSRNEQAMRFVPHIGFVAEATLADAHPKGDLVLFTMTRSQCRWLDRGKNGKKLSTAS